MLIASGEKHDALIHFPSYFHPKPIILSLDMESRMKRKADKISRQSFALLERIKAKKSKPQEQGLQGQVQQLYKTVLRRQVNPSEIQTNAINQISSAFSSQRQELARLMTQETQKSKEIVSLRQQVSTLKVISEKDSSNTDAMTEQLQKLDHKNQSLLDEIKKINSKNEQQFKEIQSSRETVKRLEISVKRLEASNKQLKLMAEAATQQLETKMNESLLLAESSVDYTALEKQLEQARKAAEVANGSLSLAESEINRLEKEVSIMKEEVAQERTHKQEIKQRQAALQSKLEELSTQLAEQRQTSTHNSTVWKDKLQKNINEKKELSKKIEKQQGKISELQQSIKKMAGDHQRQIKEAHQLTEVKDKHWKELYETRMSEVDEVSKDSEKETMMLREQLDELKVKMKVEFEKSQEHEGRLKEWEQERGELKQKIFELQTVNNALKDELNNSTKDTETKEKKHEKIFKRMQGLEEKEKELLKSIAEEKDKHNLSQSKLSEQKKTTNNLKAQIEMLKKEKDTGESTWSQKEAGYRQKIDELTEKVRYFKEANDEFNEEKIDLISNIELLADETRSLQETVEQREAETAGYQRQTQSLLNRLTSAEQELREMKDKVGEMRNQVVVQVEKEFQGKLSAKVNQIDELRIELARCQIRQQEVEGQQGSGAKRQKADPQQGAERNAKLMQTIEELTAQLTESYSTINQLSARVKQLETTGSSAKDQGRQSGRRSPQKKQRNRSLKKIAGMLGL